VDHEQDYVLRRQLSANYQGLTAVLIPAPFNALFISWPLLGHLPLERLAFWVLLILLHAIAGLVLRARFLKLTGPAPLRPWLHLRIAHAASGGLAWGAYAASLLWLPGNLELQFYLLVIVSLTAAGALVSTGMLFRAFSAYVIPCVLPCILRFASVPDRVHLTTAIELSVLLAVLLMGGRGASRASRTQLTLAQHNDELIKDLRHAENARKSIPVLTSAPAAVKLTMTSR